MKIYSFNFSHSFLERCLDFIYVLYSIMCYNKTEMFIHGQYFIHINAVKWIFFFYCSASLLTSTNSIKIFFFVLFIFSVSCPFLFIWFHITNTQRTYKKRVNFNKKTKEEVGKIKIKIVDRNKEPEKKEIKTYQNQWASLYYIS